MHNPIKDLDKDDFKGLNSQNTDFCTLELTVATGLEEVAALECKEKLNLSPQAFRGRVVVDVPISSVTEIFKFRSIDNISVLVGADKLVFPHEREDCFKLLFKSVNQPDWKKGISIWQNIFPDAANSLEDIFANEKKLVEGFVTPRPEVDLKLMHEGSSVSVNLPDDLKNSFLEKARTVKNGDPKKNSLGKNASINGETSTSNPSDCERGNASPKSLEEVDKETKCTGNEVNLEARPEENIKSVSQQDKGVTNKSGPSFRVTCHRVGSNHKFGSSEAARQFGGAVNEKFGWPVDLSHYKLEILLNIIEEFVYVAIELTKEPLFKRNLTHFGATNLRATIAYSLVKLAKPTVGDIVVDPMCGGSSIPIEGALSHKGSFHLGGDIVESAITRSFKNIDHLISEKKKSLPINTVLWDTTALPLRDQSVDVVVCDLPFGKRCGSKADNRVLYFKTLVELARVTRVSTGRAVLLTHDKKSIVNNLAKVSTLWKSFSTRSINIGGLVGCVFLLQRSQLLNDPSVCQEASNTARNKAHKRKLSNMENKNELANNGETQ